MIMRKKELDCHGKLAWMVATAAQYVLVLEPCAPMMSFCLKAAAKAQIEHLKGGHDRAKALGNLRMPKSLYQIH